MQSRVQQHTWVGVACVDWDNPRLLSSGFYPEDIPAEWHLTYYANYIMASVLSAKKWQTSTDVEVAEWIEQTQENFWFYLMCDSLASFELASSRAQAFKQKLAGLIVPENLAHLAQSSDIEVLVLGKTVYCYEHTQLREAKTALIQWLASEDVKDHALVLLTAECAHEVQNVQTLLTLLGSNA